MTPSFRHRAVLLTLFAFLAMGRTLSHAEEPSSNGTSTAIVGELPAPPPSEMDLPKWLLRAEDFYAKALKFQEAGKKEEATQLFKKAMKELSKSDLGGASFYQLKDEFDALFAKIEENLAMGVAETDTLEVSESELQNISSTAPVQGSPSVKKYSIPILPDDPLVQKYIAVYTGSRRKEMENALRRMGRYKDMIQKILAEQRLPPELLYLPIIESEFSNNNVSHAGAVGLWQFMSATGRAFNLKINYWIDERRDPEKATISAAKYLKQLYQWFDDWHLALAAYNRGEYGIQRDMEFSRSPGFSHLAERQALPNETAKYIPKFMAAVLIADNPAFYGFNVTPDTPTAPTDVLALPRAVDLKIAAECAGITEDELKEMNPALRVWCTPKNMENFQLKIPNGLHDRFAASLSQVKDWTPSTGYVKYRVQRGDWLERIAKKFRTSVKAIKADNHVKNDRALRPGQVLMIRPGTKWRGEEESKKKKK
ncbi:MAG TPA: transglycosylase SLT domain-containing protein [Elusimicrobiota bacterium]|nr:transglycosylase SLT domain-containing protein [Elusimicrobiota bacterium]